MLQFRSGLVVAFILAISCVACRDQNPPLTDTEIEKITRDAPEVVVERNGRLSLEGLDGLYLGQDQESALAWMNEQCERFVTLEGGVRREASTFKGCDTPGHDFLYSFRVGFTSRADDRVFTLELKRRNLPAEVVRARFSQHAEDVHEQVVRPGIVRVESARHNFFADWDEGAQGPTHILIGLSDDGVKSLNSEHSEE